LAGILSLVDHILSRLFYHCCCRHHHLCDVFVVASSNE
jgi:hypothetical protein